VWTDFPEADPALLVDDVVEVPVQVAGKVKARVSVPADADAATIESLALADLAVVAAIGDRTVQRVVVVPGRMVNIVV
jgi:leucyl-tRNA synthetase